MNIETLQKRIEDITKEMFNYRATYSKLEGHLQEANHWLSLMLPSQEAKTESHADEEIPVGTDEKILTENT